MGGVRFGMPAKDIVSCVNCGLTNESDSYVDVLAEERKTINPEAMSCGSESRRPRRHSSQNL